MRRFLRAILILVAAVVVLAAVMPLIVPIPPLEGTMPPDRLGDADSRFIDLKGLKVHYKMAGQGKPAFVLLHGFLASTFSWREVMAPLATMGTVLAFDRPAFGLTSRPMPGQWTGQNPYSQEAQVDLVVALLDALGMEKAILVGNSAGGTVAMLTALRYPARVEALVLVDAAVYTGGGSPRWLRPLLSLPQVRRLAPLLIRSVTSWGVAFGKMAWHDPSKLTDEIWEGYKKPLKAENWDRALYEFTVASRPANLPAQLGKITMPSLVITGDDDRIVPTAESVRLARELANAKLVVIPNCGHIPQEECPEAFMDGVREFVAALGGK